MNEINLPASIADRAHTSHHLRQKDDCNDNIAVVTSNTTPQAFADAAAVTGPPWETTCTTASCSPVAMDNCCDPLAFDHDDIVVDSEASEGFAGAETHGTNCRPVAHGVVMASATRQQETSIAEDKHDMGLPAAAKECHVLPEGTIERPLLSVGKSCDAGLDVWFKKGGKHAHFFDDRTHSLSANRDPVMQLCVLPQHPQTMDDICGRHLKPVLPRFAKDDISTHVAGINQRHGLNADQPIGLGSAPQRRLLAFNAHEHASNIPGFIHCLHASTPPPDFPRLTIGLKPSTMATMLVGQA